MLEQGQDMNLRTGASIGLALQKIDSGHTSGNGIKVEGSRVNVSGFCIKDIYILGAA